MVAEEACINSFLHPLVPPHFYFLCARSHQTSSLGRPCWYNFSILLLSLFSRFEKLVSKSKLLQLSVSRYNRKCLMVINVFLSNNISKLLFPQTTTKWVRKEIINRNTRRRCNHIAFYNDLTNVFLIHSLQERIY